MIGDNLASNVTASVVEAREQNNSAFVLLAPNSTHLTQPLNVAVFRPLKRHWRKVLENFKKHVKGTCHTFVNPVIDDYSDIDKEDIIKVLPEPTLDKKCRMIFDVDVNLWPK